MRACQASQFKRAVEFIGALQILPECRQASSSESGMGGMGAMGSQIVGLSMPPPHGDGDEMGDRCSCNSTFGIFL